MAEAKNRLKQLRKEAHKDMTTVANDVGISYSSIRQYEIGLRTPRPNVQKVLAEYFGVDVDYLMGRSEIRKDKDLLQIIKTPLTEEELSIIKAFRKTSKRNKQAIKILLGFYLIDEENE